ncbi:MULTISPECIES: hypothetical protein [unclassified Acinetobacter]|uniref:hypothetical protein n=1 Tax=unclassified Acinetobacter TaxID=196816 RepID=UPI0029345D2D|nr:MULTISPECIES: hypothetical protein [unclassified Acinetobacter]WOE31380.1 hypothetical protein QSG84_13835 [Acinetobacter sp. SAAs470]WOE39576.1 hypothetical protein QSG86_07500 [Acinetobacter sp. SAAs474]
MDYFIYIQLNAKTFQHFQQIRQQLNQYDAQPLAKPLGRILTDIACEVIEQVFGTITEQNFKGVGETEQTITQIKDYLRHYMPWSIALLSNQRLVPMVNYLYDQIVQQSSQQVFLTYPIDYQLARQALHSVRQLDLANIASIQICFDIFIDIIDQGVNCLIYQPKALLKFNFIVDKTLNGVIKLSTQLAYKRIEKIASQLSLDTAQDYFHYFITFLKMISKDQPLQYHGIA